MDIEVNVLDIEEHTYTYYGCSKKNQYLKYTLNYKYQNQTIYLRNKNGEDRGMFKLWKRKYILKDIKSIIKHSIKENIKDCDKEKLIKEFKSKPITIHINDKLK